MTAKEKVMAPGEHLRKEENGKGIERRKGEDRGDEKSGGGGEVVKSITEQTGLKTDWANRKMSVCMLESVVQPIASCTQ